MGEKWEKESYREFYYRKNGKRNVKNIRKLNLNMIIGVVSGKGGVGKTTIASNLSYYLSQVGKSVTLVDCNVTTSHINFNFGFFNFNKTLNNVLRGEAEIWEATYKYKTLNIIPASLRLEDLSYIDFMSLSRAIRSINSEFVFLDSAPGFGKEAISVLNSVDSVLIVSTPFMTSIADVLRMKKVLGELNVYPLGIVLNMVKGKHYELSKKDVEAITGMKVVEVVPYDENVEHALSLGKPFIEVFPNTKASLAIKRMANKLFGVEIVEKMGFFDGMKKGILELFRGKFKII
jgi:MinD-like ATPase involved in chromosome partitioning or flagellar assembly